MKNNINLDALAHDIKQGHVSMNPLFYAPPFNMTAEKPKKTDIKKIKEKRESEQASGVQKRKNSWSDYM